VCLWGGGGGVFVLLFLVLFVVVVGGGGLSCFGVVVGYEVGGGFCIVLGGGWV